MKNKKLIYGILVMASLAGLGIAIYLRNRKRGEGVVSSPEENTIPVEKDVTGSNVTDKTPPIEITQPAVSNLELELTGPERPDFYDDDMQLKLEGLVNWYSTNGDYSTGYADWIKKWPGEKYRVKNPDDYLFETAIQDLLGKNIINRIQAVYLRKYYGIGWEILAPKDRNKLKPTWLNMNDWEYHMWWYFNYFYHEQKYGNIKDSFYKALDTMGRDNGISADKIQAAKDYYDTSRVI